MPREGLPAIIQGLNEWLPRPTKEKTFLLIRVVRVEEGFSLRRSWKPFIQTLNDNMKALK
jgi:hypothetical protein